jgi:hypothetical protein
MGVCHTRRRVDSIFLLCVLLHLRCVGVCVSVSISTLILRLAWLEAGPRVPIPLLILLLARSV